MIFWTKLSLAIAMSITMIGCSSLMNARNAEGWVEKGTRAFHRERYQDARKAFEQALLQDPYNLGATRYLKRINMLVPRNLNTDGLPDRIVVGTWSWDESVKPLPPNSETLSDSESLDPSYQKRKKEKQRKMDEFNARR